MNHHNTLKVLRTNFAKTEPIRYSTRMTNNFERQELSEKQTRDLKRRQWIMSMSGCDISEQELTEEAKRYYSSGEAQAWESFLEQHGGNPSIEAIEDWFRQRDEITS